MKRDITKYADPVHLRDTVYLSIWEEVEKEFTKGANSDPKAPWVVERGVVVPLQTPPGLEKSWEDFLQGKCEASEVQLWNPEELFLSPTQNQWSSQSINNWQPWAGNPSRGGRARGHRGRGGRRSGRGRGSGGRPYWARTHSEYRPQGARNYIFY